MKKTITIPGFIYAGIPDSWMFGDANVIDGVSYRFSVYDNPSQAKVAAFELVFDAPAQEDITAGFVAELNSKKSKLMAECQNQVTAIDCQIQQLLAITNEVTA